MRVEIADQGLKATPPITVTALAWVHNMTLPDAVALATLIYIVMQAGYLLWKWYREWRKSRV